MGAKGRKTRNASGQKDARLWVKQEALSAGLKLGFKKQIRWDSSGEELVAEVTVGADTEKTGEDQPGLRPALGGHSESLEAEGA